MRLRKTPFLALVLLAVACSGPGAKLPAGGKFAQPEKQAESPPPRTADKASRVKLPKSLPPASMFIGSASWRTGPSRYCLGDACETLAAKPPSPAEGASGAAVMFSVSAAPRAARLDVLASGGSEPEKVPLNPGTAMTWQATLPPGTYGLTLVATYQHTEVSWPFAVRIKPADKR